jgi:hypothetical protein
MTSEETNWNSRLAVKFMPAGGKSEIISPITNFSPNLDLPHEIIDSIDGHNLGYSSGNPRFTFDFEIQGVNKSVFRKIFSVALKGTRFSVGIAVNDGLSDDWLFDSIEFSNCMVTSVTPSTFDNSGGIPTLKFTASCLDVMVSNDGQALVNTHTAGATGDLT